MIIFKIILDFNNEQTMLYLNQGFNVMGCWPLYHITTPDKQMCYAWSDLRAPFDMEQFVFSMSQHKLLEQKWNNQHWWNGIYPHYMPAQFECLICTSCILVFHNNCIFNTLTLVLRRGVAQPPNGFCPCAQKRAGKG